MKHDVSNIIKQANEMGISNRRIAKASGVGRSTVNRAAKEGYLVGEKIRFAINAGVNVLKLTAHLPANHWINKPFSPDLSALMLEPMKTTPTATLAANLEKQVDELRDTVITMQPLSDASIEKSIEDWKARCDSGEKIQMIPLRDDLLESAHSREKAELQKALAERVDQLAQANLSVARQEGQLVYLRTEINRLNAMLERSNAQAQSSLADLTKANKRLACQSENIDTLQQQLAAERVANNDTIERLQSDIDILKHDYAKAQHAINDRDTRITQITKDKVSLSHLHDRLQSRAEVFKITAFTAGMALLVALVYVVFGDVS